MVNEIDKVDIDPFSKGDDERLVRELNVAAQASKEQMAAAKDILKKQSDDALKASFTNPSAIALSETSKESGNSMNNNVRKTVKQLLNLYLTNQFVARAVNVRADTLIYKGYKVFGEDQIGIKACEELIENSGGNNFFWQLSVNSVTKDTPILIKYPDDSIDIIEMSELYKDKEDSSNIGRYSTQEIRDLQVMTDEGWKKIKYVFRHKIKEDIYKINTGTGLAKVTHDHSLMSNGNEVHSKDLKIGTNIDVVDIIDNSLNHDIWKEISDDMAWLCGFFVADGTAGTYKTGKQWKITNKNRKFLEKSELIIKENIDKNAKTYWYNDIGHVSFSTIKNEEWFNWFLNKCYTPNRFKRVPQSILNSSKTTMESFMEGYWAGDGAKYTSWRNSSYATDSFSLIAGIEYIVKMLGKSISLTTIKNRENVYLIRIRDSFEDKHINGKLEQLNSIMKSEYDKKESLSDDEISLITEIPRRTISYYRSLNNIPSKYERQKIYDLENSEFVFLKDNHLDYLTKRKQDGIIEEIRKEFYDDYVYDIATENHRFVAGVGGLLHHNTDIAGDGFDEKIYNKKKNKILKLKHVHPLTLEFTKDDKTGKIILGPDKEPKSYTQYYIDSEGKEQKRIVPKENIEHLRFNTLGDEFTGISTIQPGYNTIVRLMNMEFSAAEAAIKTANPLIVGTANTKSPHQIAQWGQVLGRISGQEQVFIPDGMKLEMLSPGQQNFSDYADYFLNAVVATFGVPKSVLLGASDGGSNRAEGIVLTRHFYSLIRSNQRYIEDFMNKIFKEYAYLAGFKPPKLVFEDIAEDAAGTAQAAMELFQAGLISREEARNMIGLEGPGIIQKPSDIQTDMKKSDMQTWHPATENSPAGSQKGEKKAMKTSTFSEVKANSK